MSKASFSARAKAIASQLRKAVRHILFHNGWVKLIAVLISLLLWAGLISQDETLTRDKTWQNVKVNITGADKLRNNSLIVVSDLDELLSGVTLTAAVPQKQYDTATASVFNARVDLSSLNGTGTQELRILTTGSNTYGQDISTVPSVITVEVEEYFVRQRIPVNVVVGGESQNVWYGNWYMPTPSVDPALIAVSGPRALVQTISRAKVMLDPETLDWSEGTLFTTGDIQLYNRAGDPVSDTLLGITTESLSIDTVLIEANVLPVKTFQMSDQVTVSDSRITSVKFSPETVKVAARSVVLDQLEALTLDVSAISADDLEQGTNVVTIRVQKPSEDAVLSNDTVVMTLEVDKGK